MANNSFSLPNDYITRAKRVEKIGIPVVMPDGTTRIVRNALTDEKANVKLSKSAQEGHFYTVGLSLAPADSAGIGNLCPFASPGCKSVCLATAGKGGLKSVTDARIAKTRAMFGTSEQRQDFVSLLVYQLEKARTKAQRKGKTLAVRLNVLSDIPFERTMPYLFERFSDVQFYDYTKNPNRFGTLPANYDLTFSRSECNDVQVLDVLRNGGRVAVVFEKTLPASWNGYPVVNADLHDLRFLDGNGVISGLKAKGKARTDKGNGFVIPLTAV